MLGSSFSWQKSGEKNGTHLDRIAEEEKESVQMKNALMSTCALAAHIWQNLLWSLALEDESCPLWFLFLKNKEKKHFMSLSWASYINAFYFFYHQWFPFFVFCCILTKILKMQSMSSLFHTIYSADSAKITCRQSPLLLLSNVRLSVW